jgi:uncharacterized protein YeeX (DUF496 family)
MSEEEMRYVCSVIPLQDSVLYFKRNPKYFAKIMPGFRATSLKNQGQVSGVLYRSRNQHFVFSFIESHISTWITDIGKAIEKHVEDGESMESALLKVLPHTYFVDNVELYFKLTEEEFSEDYISLLAESVKEMKKILLDFDASKSELLVKKVEIERLEAEIIGMANEKSKYIKMLADSAEVIKSLQNENRYLGNFKDEVASLEQAIIKRNHDLQERENLIIQLKQNISSLRTEHSQLEDRIRDEVIRQAQITKHRRSIPTKPKRPDDIDEFKDYLGYNLESIGIPTNDDCFSVLKDHLCEILFQGVPIIISKGTMASLTKCISNTLVETPIVPVMVFSNEVTDVEIVDFISQNCRVLCLDNFIGNYNETILISLCEKHRDKIIFLTVSYDHTLAYVPDELMVYCHYLNVNRIEALRGEKEIEEEPSSIVESAILDNFKKTDTRWSSLCNEILKELGIRGAVTAAKVFLVNSELSLCRLLIFDILPYCIDVLKITPFNISERLVKYAGDSGRCPYKTLIRRWFT